jgi:adenosylhomocysteine nucleosidase
MIKAPNGIDQGMASCSINLVAALPAEAKPIVTRFGLTRAQPDLGFPLYRREQVTLALTGPGKINAAAATALLGALDNRRQEAVWVNLGVAGHAERPIGDVLLASRVTDAASGKVWQPSLPEIPPCPAGSLLTRDRPDLSYEHEGMVDMEASGFFPIACRFSSVELVQVLKVVSDNRGNPARSLGTKQVRALMGEVLETLEVLLVRLEKRVKGRRETIEQRQTN